MIHVESLSAGYDRQPVLSDLSLCVPQGRVTVLVGPNGCGKSTLLRAMARLHKPKRGRVLLEGRDIWQQSPRQVARLMALLPQSPQAPAGLCVEDLVRLGRHPHQGLLRQWSAEDADAVDRALLQTGLVALADRPLAQLSGGQRQRAWLAMTLAQQTPCVLLDEPTSALDIGHQIEVLEVVRQLAEAGKTLIVVMHDLFMAARYGDHLVALHEGRIVAEGAPGNILTPTLVEQLYGVSSDRIFAPVDQTPIMVPRAISPTFEAQPTEQLLQSEV